MLRKAILGLILALAAATPADARLFRQTYGATIPAQGSAAGDCGSTWNWNQDFFVPRYATSGRYDLFSPCKVARTRSPAAWHGSQLYPGYCTVYGAPHYRWRNHVYGTYCGCKPLQPYCGPWRNKPCCRNCGPRRSSCSAGLCEMLENSNGLSHFCPSPCGILPGVEPVGLALLGSIPVDSDDLLAGGLLPTAPIGGGVAIPEGLTDQLRALQPLLGSPNNSQLPSP